MGECEHGTEGCGGVGEKHGCEASGLPRDGHTVARLMGPREARLDKALRDIIALAERPVLRDGSPNRLYSVVDIARVALTKRDARERTDESLAATEDRVKTWTENGMRAERQRVDAEIAGVRRVAMAQVPALRIRLAHLEKLVLTGEALDQAARTSADTTVTRPWRLHAGEMGEWCQGPITDDEFRRFLQMPEAEQRAEARLWRNEILEHENEQLKAELAGRGG